MNVGFTDHDPAAAAAVCSDGQRHPAEGEVPAQHGTKEQTLTIRLTVTVRVRRVRPVRGDPENVGRLVFDECNAVIR